MALQDRQGMLDIVAVAIVEGERREGPPGRGAQPAGDVVHRHDVPALMPEFAEHRIEKGRLDFEPAMRVERGRLVRADMMKHQDRAQSLRRRLHQSCEPACRKSAQAKPEGEMAGVHACSGCVICDSSTLFFAMR